MILETLSQSTTDPQVLGLLFDIIGAFYVVRSFIRKNLEEMNIEAHGGKEGLPYDTLYGALVQKIEAEIGLWFLVPGFFIQAIGVIYVIQLPSLVVIIVPLVTYLIAGLYFNYATDYERFKNAVDI